MSHAPPDAHVHPFSGILGGDLVLENLTLRKDVVQNALQLPLDYDISRGVIRELRLSIPWTRILSQSQPVLQITLRHIEIVVVPVVKALSPEAPGEPPNDKKGKKEKVNGWHGWC
jgi:hypothetical protein